MRPRTARGPILFGVAALLVGCGGSSTGGAGGAGGASPSPSAASKPGAAATAQSDKEIWFAGWHLTFGEVAYKPPIKPSPGRSPVSGELTMQVKFENLGLTNAAFNSVVTVKSNGNQYTYAGRSNNRPQVPGKASGAGVIGVEADDKFNLDDAVVTVGTAKTNQAFVPLGRTGKLVDLKPVPLNTSGTLALAGAYTVNVVSGTFSYDQPLRHVEMDAGSGFITLGESITGDADRRASFGPTSATLKVPTGIVITADDVTPCCTAPVKGTTMTDGAITFFIKAPLDGAYTLVVKTKAGPTQTEVMAEFPFNITVGGS